MPQKPKDEPKKENQESDPKIEDSWEEDQKKRDYYYDDSHGYEVYDPESDEDD
jgi:hypothetical protein